MDPRVVKGLTVLAALGMYFYFGGVPPTFDEFVRQMSLVLLGGVAIRRPGDLGPVHEDAP